MKIIIYYFVLITIISFISCSNNSIVDTEDINKSSQKIEYRAKFVIYHESWSEWGRRSKNCKSWGLCNFQDCWFCCVDETGEVVPCMSKGIILIDTIQVRVT